MSDERLRFARWVQEAEAGRGNNVTAEIVAELRAEVDRLRAAILWADGQGDEFPPRPEGRGPYWWRAELMRRAGLGE